MLEQWTPELYYHGEYVDYHLMGRLTSPDRKPMYTIICVCGKSQDILYETEVKERALGVFEFLTSDAYDIDLQAIVKEAVNAA